ncbi:BRO-N domain-containing protein [Nostoc sp.]
MSNLTIFAFEGQEVRFVGTPDKPEWIAQDVANVLEIKNVHQNLANLEDYEKGICKMDTLGGEQQMLTVTEPGLYSLIFKSRKLVAKRLKKWVTSEVLPSIRRTGKYEVPTPESEPQLDPTPQLQSRRIAIETAEAVTSIKSLLAESEPRLAQILVDYAMNDVLEGMPTAKMLPELKQPELRGVAEIAADMGYPITHSNRSSLGKFVKKQLEHLGKQERRLCNGTMRLVWCYPDSSVVRGVISEYFS